MGNNKKYQQFDTPILLLTFNRPNSTKKVFEEIEKIKPKKLYIAYDGPRQHNERDKFKCMQVRNITKTVNWNCEVKTLFRTRNLGGPIANSSAITWFFENEKEGIILEDDCLPNESFFYFCKELLEKYKDNEKIMSISGNNFQFGKKRGDADYYFSIYNHCWGWATWRRAWQYWNKEFSKNFINFKKNKTIEKITKNRATQKYWMNIFQSIYENKKNNWDYIWTFSCWTRGGITCLPNVNLVSNIGFGPDAQHTTNKNDKMSNMPTNKMQFPLIHPEIIRVNKKADDYTSKNIFKTQRNKINTIINFIKLILKRMKLFEIVKKLYIKYKK